LIPSPQNRFSESLVVRVRRQHQAKKALVTELPVQIGGTAESQLHIPHVKDLRAEALLGQPSMDVVSENAILLRRAQAPQSGEHLPGKKLPGFTKTASRSLCGCLTIGNKAKKC